MASCNICEINFSNISNLRAHIKRKHPGKVDCLAPKVRKPSALCPNVHVCNECSKTFVSFGNLRFHVKQKHSDKLEELAPVKVRNYKCSECNVEFQVLQHLIQHRRSHNAEVLRIQCPLCEYRGVSTDTLIIHYKEEHSLEISIVTLEFKCFEAFEHWKSTLEKESFASFIKIRGSSQNANYTKIDYKCHRSGEYKATGKNIRHLKTQGSNKIGGFCPAKISVIIKNDKCIVHFCGNHVGHQQQNDLGHHFLPKSNQDVEGLQSESNLVMDIGNTEVAAPVKSISTDRPRMQSNLQQHILLQKQEILEKFQSELFAANSQDEIDVFKRILAPLKPSLAGVRNQMESTFVPLTPSKIASNKNIEPQRRKTRKS